MVTFTPEQARAHEHAMKTAKQHNTPLVGHTEHELTQFAYTDSSPPNSDTQRDVQHGSVGAAEGKEVHTGGICVLIKSFRVRSLDPDNICPKYFIDSLRYAGLIPNDTAKDIFIPPIIQVQVKTKAEQRTEITVIRGVKATITIEPV